MSAGGRDTASRRVAISVRLPLERFVRLKTYTARNRTSIQATVSRLIDELLAKWEAEPRDETA